MSANTALNRTRVEVMTVPNETETWSTRVINDPLHWQSISRDWDKCFPSPMQSYAWLSAWWNHFKFETTAQLAILAISHHEKDIAFAPFYVERTKFGNTVKLLGSGEVCSDYLDLGFNQELSSEHKATVIETFAGYVKSEPFTSQFGLIDCIELEGFSENQTGLVAFIDHCDASNWENDTVALEGCWPTHFAETWNKYELELSKSRRRKVRKALKWVDEKEVCWEKVQSADKLSQVWPDVIRLHTQRRGMLGQSGCFAENRFEGFLFDAMKQLIETNAGFVATLYEGSQRDRAIAILIVLTSDNRWQIYQSGADPNVMDREPGHSLNAIVLKDAFESGIREVDFLRGDEPYKEGWFAQRVPLYRTRLFANHFSARLRLQALRAHRQWKMWTKSVSNIWSVKLR